MKYKFDCNGCGIGVQMSAYAIAQLASGNELVYICPKCSEKTVLTKQDLA